MCVSPFFRSLSQDPTIAVESFEFILDKARETLGLDADSPVYARGHSSGGEFCYRLAKDGLLNGMVVSGANYIYDNLEPPVYDETFTEPDISFVFIIHGVNDTLVPYDNSRCITFTRI